MCVDPAGRGEVLVVSGETGCGKTTQLPQFIMEDMIERGERTGGGGATTPHRSVLHAAILQWQKVTMRNEIPTTLG